MPRKAGKSASRRRCSWNPQSRSLVTPITRFPARVTGRCRITPGAAVSRSASWWLLWWPTNRTSTLAARFCDPPRPPRTVSAWAGAGSATEATATLLPGLASSGPPASGPAIRHSSHGLSAGRRPTPEGLSVALRPPAWKGAASGVSRTTAILYCLTPNIAGARPQSRPGHRAQPPATATGDWR